MIIVASVCFLAATTVITLTFARVVQSLIRQHARERDLLVNQVCNLAGNPWQPPPATQEPVVEPVDEQFVFSTEHEPDY